MDLMAFHMGSPGGFRKLPHVAAQDRDDRAIMAHIAISSSVASHLHRRCGRNIFALQFPYPRLNSAPLRRHFLRSRIRHDRIRIRLTAFRDDVDEEGIA
ncbi:hypothetical protein NB311A_05213 [Nitrobacter sp. Nb-311A]|nr:hypothetical protein NB311A_05213 [Nitrobacter sp. Nb-311A]